MSNDDKFARNRQKFRKVYNYGLSRPPDIRQFIDSVTGTTQSLNFQKVIRDHDFYVVNPEIGTTPSPSPPPQSVGFDANLNYPAVSYSSLDLLAWWRFETINNVYVIPDDGPTGLHTLTGSSFDALQASVDPNFNAAVGDAYQNINSVYVPCSSIGFVAVLQDTQAGAFEFAPKKPFSFSCHVKYDTFAFIANVVPLVWRGNLSSGYADWEVLLMNDGSIHAGVFNNSNGYHRVFQSSAGVITIGSWYHIGVTFDGLNFQFFVNGSPITTTLEVDTGWTQFTNSPTSVFQIGEAHDLDYIVAAQLQADLHIDQTAIYGRVLTNAEMLVLYNGVII